MSSPQPAPPSQRTGKPKRKQAFLEATDAQRSILNVLKLCAADAATTTDRELRARIGSAMAQMARGWELLEDRKRILRNKPLPGHLRPDLTPKPRRIAPSFSSAEAIDITEAPKESLLLRPEGRGTPPPGGAVSGASSV